MSGMQQKITSRENSPHNDQTIAQTVPAPQVPQTLELAHEDLKMIITNELSMSKNLPKPKFEMENMMVM